MTDTHNKYTLFILVYFGEFFFIKKNTRYSDQPVFTRYIWITKPIQQFAPNFFKPDPKID